MIWLYQGIMLNPQHLKRLNALTKHGTKKHMLCNSLKKL